MKVLVISDLFPPAQLGGYELSCAQIVAELRRRNHSVKVLTAAPPVPVDADDQADHEALRILRATQGFRFYRSRGASSGPGTDPARLLVTRRLADMTSKYVCAENVYSLSREIERFQPDVAYLWSLRAIGGLGIIAALDYWHLPWVWHLGDNVPASLCEFDRRPVPPLVNAVQPLIKGPCLAVSSRVVSEIERQGPRLEGGVALIPGWIDEPATPPLAPPYRPGQPLRILYSGIVTSFKGVQIAIDAVAAAHHTYPDLRLDVIGPVVEPRLQHDVNRRSLNSVITFYGALAHDELLKHLLTAHVFIFPTWEREPFGLGPLEAASRGVVPIISESCGIAEWLVDGLHCVKAPRSADGFASALRQIASGEIELAQIARRAHVAALRDFSVARWAPAVERALADAASQGEGLTGSAAVAHQAALVAEQVISATIEDATLGPRA